MKKENVRSTIQADFNDLIGREGICIHHVFPGFGRRRKCEKYGYLVAINKDVHDLIHKDINGGLSLMLKQDAQKNFERYHGTRQDFIREFGKSYL